MKRFFLYLLIFVYTFPVFATVFYVDPVNGSMEYNGSRLLPWRTFQEVIEYNLIESRQWQEHPPTENTALIIKNPDAPVKAGDTILLRNGYHGSVRIVEFFNTGYITIMSESGHFPTMSNIEVVGGCFWRFARLMISPSYAETYQRRSVIDFESHNWRGPVYNCEVKNCLIFSVDDAGNWNMQQWDTMSCNGISVSGNKNSIKNNYLKNVNFGISVSGDSTLVKGNIIENFAGDGLRGIGSDLTFEYNTVKNCFDVNGNHDDGFQSWSIDDQPPRERVVLRGNLIINYTDENQPFKGTLQGIGCFDGFYIDWIIENNVVITDHWHGINLSGAINCRIVNNTVIDENNETPGPPWIRISDHKDGTPSENCLIRNNIATDFGIGTGVSGDHNIEITYADYVNYFEDARNFNLNLIEGCDAIDAGNPELAPVSDKEKKVRPYGNGIDIGAFEFGSFISEMNQTNDSGKEFLYNCPNPFTQYSVIHYELDRSGFVSIVILDITGKIITTLENENKKAGTHQVQFNPGKYDLNTGFYLCKLITEERRTSILMQYMK